MNKTYGLSLTKVETSDYFYFKSVNTESTSFKVEWRTDITIPQDATAKEFEYSFDKIHWNDVTINTAITFDNYIFLRAKSSIGWANKAHNYVRLTVDKPCAIGGELGYLIHYENFGVLTINSLCRCLFINNTNITDASKLKLINGNTVAQYCYASMFQGCTALAVPPSFQNSPYATDLEPACYISMFEGCTSLNTLPLFLSNVTLNHSSCQSMFKNCTNIKISNSQGYTDGVNNYDTAYPIPPAIVDASYPVTDMFTGTGGWTTTVTPGVTYYTANNVI